MLRGSGWQSAAVAAVAWLLGGAPAAAQAAASDPKPAGPPARTSWTSDRAPLAVGDVVTILIDEYTSVSADRNEQATRDRNRDLGLTAGTGGKSTSGSARTNNDVSRQDRGESSRSQRFTAEMGVRVVEVGPGGMLRLEGSRKVQVDKHQQEVVLRGWVRPNDVAVDNTVPSWRVAEAEILFRSNGSLVSAGGVWTRLLELIVP
jgi:flagellar L-ring protein precursor FlgH